jgi:hypothetical protein
MKCDRRWWNDGRLQAEQAMAFEQSRFANKALVRAVTDAGIEIRVRVWTCFPMTQWTARIPED